MSKSAFGGDGINSFFTEDDFKDLFVKKKKNEVDSSIVLISDSSEEDSDNSSLPEERYSIDEDRVIM